MSAAEAVGTVRQCHLPDERVFQQISARKVPLPECGRLCTAVGQQFVSHFDGLSAFRSLTPIAGLGIDT
jgi:hypothetical protein